VVLELYKACLEELKKLFDAQSVKLVELESKMDSIACHCRSSNKGKGREVVVMEESIPNVLRSPICFQPTPTSPGSSNLSYMVPPVANESSSTVVEESLVSPLVLVLMKTKRIMSILE